MSKSFCARAMGTTLALGVLVLTGGCAVTQETRQSLAGYVQAMEQVGRSADMFVSDFTNTLKVQDELKRVAGAAQSAGPQEYPDEFRLPADAVAPQTPHEKAVAATRQALAVVHQYNDALVALAEGHSEQEVKQRTTALGDALQALLPLADAVPGLSTITGVGAKIIKLAQDASNRQQLKEALAQGREPVNTILTVLEQQTPAMYKASVIATSQGQGALKKSILRSAEPLREMLAGRGPPTDNTVESKWTAAQSQLAEIGVRTRTAEAMPKLQPFTPGKPAYDGAAQAEIQVFVQSMDTYAQRYSELVAKQNAYYKMMVKYVATLREARQGLDLVTESLNRPVDLRAEVTRLLQVAFDLRDAVSAYRHPLAP